MLCLSFLGCSNFNPRNNPKIENQNGQIEDIKTNQNGVMLELAKVRQQGEITNSTLKDIQQGLLNINAAVSKNENSSLHGLHQVAQTSMYKYFPRKFSKETLLPLLSLNVN